MGVACSRMQVELETYRGLGYQPEGGVFEDAAQGIRGQFLSNGSLRVELLEPLNDTSPIRPFLERGVRWCHEAYLCDDIDETIRKLEAAGARVVRPPKAAIAFGGRRIAFLFWPNRMLIELIEIGAA